MLSPRATRSGYHWQDTLAHELTHLLVTRATRDRAPLWLQEGVAKREENRWRDPRPFDAKDWADVTATRALRRGRAIGLDKLGPSIAMLPTPEEASTAYAEVQSFVSYFIREQGEPALRLLFTDLKGLAAEDPTSALRSVSGYDLSQWNLRWQKHLLDAPVPAVTAAPRAAGGGDPRDLARRARLGDLLLDHGYGREAATVLAPGDGGSSAAYRFRVARAELARHDVEQAAKRLGAEAEIDGLFGPWFALRGRLLEATDPAAAARAFELGLASDPLSEEAACHGRFSVGAELDDPKIMGQLDPASAALCEAARKLPRD
jgi:hypothetical protein